MSSQASGAFSVKLSPLPPYNGDEGASLGRMAIDKHFHGALEATSKGEMLTAGSVVKGSAGYVAIERVSGTLAGRSGTFVLQHCATMNRGVPQLAITVIPDSGTGALTGLSGTMGIIIADGQHTYTFDWQIAPPQ